jgi:hypothetical protein
MLSFSRKTWNFATPPLPKTNQTAEVGSPHLAFPWWKALWRGLQAPIAFIGNQRTTANIAFFGRFFIFDMVSIKVQVFEKVKFCQQYH